MAVCCDLQVEFNGEDTFMVDKKMISSYSGKLRKLFGESTGTANTLKVVFHEFPGGAESFEIISRFCYNSGRVEVNRSNIYLLYCAAQFMEMNFSVSGKHNLLEQTEKSLEETGYWTRPELLVALKHCQELATVENTSCVIEKCIDYLVGKMAMASELSPCPSTSSPDSSSFRVSCDTRSTESFKNSFSRATWWFEDLLVLSPSLVEKVIKSMVGHKFDHSIIRGSWRIWQVLTWIKFLALALALPDSARESHDEIYRATDIYLEVHAGLSEEEKKKIFFALNYDKLSSEACVHFSQDTRFRSKTAVQALKSQQLKLKSLRLSSINFKSYTNSPCNFKAIRNKGKIDDLVSEQIVLYSRKLDYSIDNKKQLSAYIQGMQLRVMELEKVCKKMQTKMSKITKSKTPSHSTARSLPRLSS